MADKIKSAFINAGIHHKMMLLITLLMLTSFAIFAAVLTYVFNIYDDQMYKKTSQVLNMSSIDIENQLKEVERLTFNVVSDQALQDHLRQLEKEESSYGRTVLHKKITNRLISLAGSEKYVYSMLLIDNEGKVMAAGNREGIPEDLRSHLVSLAQENNGSNAWFAPGDSSLLAARQIKSYTGQTFTLQGLGTLVLKVRIDRIVNERVQDEDSGQLMIVDGERLIYPEVPLLSPEGISTELQRTLPYGIESYDQESYFTAKATSSYTGWTYLHTTPFQEMFQRVQVIKDLVMGVFVLLLIVALACGAKLSVSITRPIQQLIANMRKIEQGNLDKLKEESLGRMPSPSHNEVSLLYRTYIKMIRRIRELIDENYAKQLLLRETELKALQAQINPHFLYNTLESVNWLAKLNKQDKISEMVEALAFLLRNAVNLQEQLIPLERELDIVHSYVTIQKTRFEERLNFELDLEEGVETALIPKLTLQPLVENAIHYALEPRIEPCHIIIRVRRKGSTLEICVEDDGPGMTSDFIARLHSGKVKTRGQGIGLANIEERIQLTFGQAWGVRLESGPGQGTAVHVCIPYVKGEEVHVQSSVG